MNNEYMNMAVDNAYYGVNNSEGGPFGAVIVKDGEVLSITHNTVLKDNDPTAHAEVSAIREACKKLNTYDLSGCVIYSSCEPCPMCISAIMWSNIEKIYYGTTRVDASKIGFRDNDIYDFFKGNYKKIEEIKLDSDKCRELIDSYKNKIY